MAAVDRLSPFSGFIYTLILRGDAARPVNLPQCGPFERLTAIVRRRCTAVDCDGGPSKSFREQWEYEALGRNYSGKRTTAS